jgi:tetratricopeptide (TPR) repeat protein
MLDAVPGACARAEQFVKSQVERNAPQASRYLRENDPLEYLAVKVATDIIVEKGFARFKTLCGEMKEREPYGVMVTEGFINALGSRLLQLDRRSEAIEVLTMNTEAYPQSANTYGRLAEAYLKNGDKELAIEFYKKALEIDPEFKRSLEASKKLAP